MQEIAKYTAVFPKQASKMPPQKPVQVKNFASVLVEQSAQPIQKNKTEQTTKEQETVEQPLIQQSGETDETEQILLEGMQQLAAEWQMILPLVDIDIPSQMQQQEILLAAEVTQKQEKTMMEAVQELPAKQNAATTIQHVQVVDIKMPPQQVQDAVAQSVPLEIPMVTQANKQVEPPLNNIQPIGQPKDSLEPQQENTLESIEIVVHPSPVNEKENSQAPLHAAEINAIKEKIAYKKNPQEQELNIDELQKQIDSGQHLQKTAYTPFTRIENSPLAKAELPLHTQLETGISKAVQSKDQSFTFTLAPEGLGDVTVHLEKSAIGMGVSIVTKNQETHKMLMQEINVLRENLKPLQIEIDAVLTEHQEQMMAGKDADPQRQHHHFQDFKGAAYYQDQPLGDEENAQQEWITAQMQHSIHLSNAMLSAFI